MEDYQTALKDRLRSRAVFACVPLTPEQEDRHSRLRNAVTPAMFTATTCQRFGPGYPKRLLRQVSRAYRTTHVILAAVGYDFVCSPESLLEAVENDQRARDLLSRIRRLPHTLVGAKARALALDNASVARETLEVISNMVNRSARLN